MAACHMLKKQKKQLIIRVFLRYLSFFRIFAKVM